MILSAMLAAAVPMTPIDYTIALAVVRKAPLLSVTMTLEGDADGVTDIVLPDKWAGSDGLWRAIGAPQVTGGTLIAGGAPATWRIRHTPNARLTVRYAIRDGQPGAPDANTYEKARPVVERDWVYVHNQGAIAIPAGREAASAHFRIGKVAPGWRLASDLTRVGGRALTANDIGAGIIVGGTRMRFAARPLGTRALRVEMLGRWPFRDALLVDRTAQLIGTENAMLGAASVDYLVSIAPLTGGSETGAISYGGTGAIAGFALESTDNVPIADLTRLLAHEYAHRWFGFAFGPVADGAAPYWFTEGVNDWFAGRAMVRAKLWNSTDWVDALNMVLRQYGVSSAKTLTDTELTDQFWTNPDAMQVQYDRGNLTALLIDRALAPRGGLMPLLSRMARETSSEQQDVRFVRLADAVQPGVVAMARRTAAAPLSADALAPCGRIETVQEPNYDRGFDTDDARIVTKVRTRAARDAGIRVGMRYDRRISFEYLHATVPMVADFVEKGATRRLTWLPAGATTVSFQQLRATALGSPACALLVAGTPDTP